MAENGPFGRITDLGWSEVKNIPEEAEALRECPKGRGKEIQGERDKGKIVGQGDFAEDEAN
jgi:hypothetical protein